MDQNKKLSLTSLISGKKNVKIKVPILTIERAYTPKGRKVITSDKPEDVNTLTSIGEMLKHKRTKSKLSIKKTALLCGISPNTLSSLEHGEPVKTSTLLIVLQMLGLKLKIEG